MVSACILIITLLVFTLFVVPVDYMLLWFQWINQVNRWLTAVRQLWSMSAMTALSLVPPLFQHVIPETANVACNAVGAVPGQSFINGDAYQLGM